MTRIVFLALLVFGMAAVVAVARFPLAAAAAWAPLEENGLNYARADGFLWGGRLSDATWRGNDLGHIEIAVIRHQLALGRLVAAFRSDGRDVAAWGLLRSGPTGTFRLSRLTADLRVAQRLLGAAIQGRLSIEAEEIGFDRGGTCLAADAVVRTSVLKETAAPYGWDAPELTGPVRCEGEAWAVSLSGAEGGVAVRLDGLWSVAGVRTAVMTVSGAGADLTDQLRLLGFEDADGALRYRWDGGPRGAGS